MTTEPQKAELKPCPFCGKPPRPMQGPELTWCVNQECRFRGIGFFVEEWNTRASDPASDAKDDVILSLRKRIHLIEKHNQYFERCESGWCNPVGTIAAGYNNDEAAKKPQCGDLFAVSVSIEVSKQVAAKDATIARLRGFLRSLWPESLDFDKWKSGKLDDSCKQAAAELFSTITYTAADLDAIQELLADSSVEAPNAPAELHHCDHSGTCMAPAVEIEAIAQGLRDDAAGRVTPMEEVDPTLSAEAPTRTDTERLDWLEKETGNVIYSTLSCTYKVTFRVDQGEFVSDCGTLRGAIDAAIDAQAAGGGGSVLMTPTELCPCGRPLHYLSKQSERAVRSLVADLGPAIRVNFGDRIWLVSRHYIALHGLRAAELPDLPHAIEICIDCRKVLKECICMKEAA